MSKYPEDYNVGGGSGGRYTKMDKTGPNKFRFLADPLFVTTHWFDDDGKPAVVRIQRGSGLALRDVDRAFEDIVFDMYDKRNYYSAEIHLVWNYATERTEIFEIRQQTIKEGLHGLYHNSDWGDYEEYDVTIKKSDDGKSYSVTPSPKKPIGDHIKKYMKDNPVNLEKMCATREEKKGGDPFSSDNSGLVEETLTDKEVDNLPF
jgi:hypothetical protein